MPINKSQGQTLSNVVVYLRKPVLTHSQLYVVVTWVTSKHGLKLLIEDDDEQPRDETKNIVYKEVFSKLNITSTQQ
jgi:ATP-dependent DNA helicase PIF1